jgi:hypothetical protein
MQDTTSRLAFFSLLQQSLEELEAAGRPDRAYELAGYACSLVRGRDQKAWQRFNALLHRLGEQDLSA